MKRYGTVIKEAREARQWSLKKAAAAVGTFKGYISGIETGNLNPPSPKMTRKIATVFDLDEQDLLARSILEKLPRRLKVESLHALTGELVIEREKKQAEREAHLGPIIA